MNVGFVTDVHLGMDINGETRTVLENLAAAFDERDVERVVFLGDVATVEDLVYEY
jgi:metallophosphoesterase superfamily enzyme